MSPERLNEIRAVLAENHDAISDIARELLAAYEQATDALKPFAHFAHQWRRAPLRGIADEVYSIHTGTEYAASIRLSDCERAIEALEAPHAS